MTYYTPPDIARQLEQDAHMDIVIANPPFTLAEPTSPGKTLSAVRLLRSLWARLTANRKVQP